MATNQSPPSSPGAAKAVTTASGLKCIDLQIGKGPAGEEGTRIILHYTGWLSDGTKFDSSLGGEPFKFVLGNNEVMQGWEEGIQGMQPGGKRRLIIPSELAYGSSGSADGRVPPNNQLTFDIEVLMVQRRK